MSQRPLKLYQKVRRVFPDPAKDSIDGIVAMGIPLTTSTLFEAYSFGIFPWPHPDLPLLWYCPEERGILEFKDLHIPKSLKKFMAKKPYEITFNQNFKDVIAACSLTLRPGQSGTWISDHIVKAYTEFHRAGYAHSVEVWQSGRLVGGMYGVLVAGVFAGESMFYKADNASKIALLAMIEKLQSEGHSWMDIQMLTPVTEAFGGKYVSRNKYLKMLEMNKKA
jgi:leucyl/phenylalanyl-tRNA--protein transferase